jgi:hypothetical protein
MKKILKSIDFSAQVLMLAAIVLSLFSFLLPMGGPHAIFALLIAFPLGLWQIGSAILTSIAKNSYEHGIYAFAAICYCMASVGLMYMSDSIHGLTSNFGPYELWVYFFWLFWVPPAIGAFWYLHRTYRDLAETQEVMV